MNAKTHELELVSRAALVTSEALLTFQKSLNDLIGDSDMDIVSIPDQEMSPKQKSFLEHLIKINHSDAGERNIKLEQLNSGLSRQDADVLIKQYV